MRRQGLLRVKRRDHDIGSRMQLRNSLRVPASGREYVRIISGRGKQAKKVDELNGSRSEEE